jgi:hypothetical protein
MALPKDLRKLLGELVLIVKHSLSDSCFTVVMLRLMGRNMGQLQLTLSGEKMVVHAK